MTFQNVRGGLLLIERYLIKKKREREEEGRGGEMAVKEEGHTRFTGGPVNSYSMASQMQEPVLGCSVTVMMSDCSLKTLVISDGRDDVRLFCPLNKAEKPPEKSPL